MAKRTELIKCVHCGILKPCRHYKSNDKLAGGFYPWCKDCYADMGRVSDPDKLRVLKEQYKKDYQTAYQGRYRHRLNPHSRRNRSKLSRRIIETVLPSRISVPVLRDNRVSGLLMRMIPQIQQTEMWQEFVQETIQVAIDSGKLPRAVDRSTLSLEWILDPYNYPELMFSFDNVFIKGTQIPRKVSLQQLQLSTAESLERLVDAISEL